VHTRGTRQQGYIQAIIYEDERSGAIRSGGFGEFTSCYEDGRTSNAEKLSSR
jgi:hypothetical protein